MLPSPNTGLKPEIIQSSLRIYENIKTQTSLMRVRCSSRSTLFPDRPLQSHKQRRLQPQESRISLSSQLSNLHGRGSSQPLSAQRLIQQRFIEGIVRQH